MSPAAAEAAGAGAALHAALERGLAAAPGPVLGVAVSGGGDSVALLRLARDWAARHGRGLSAITIDHGLRPEAAAEAETVARLCAGWGIPHAIRRWDSPHGPGNLQDRAREARRRLIAAWAAEAGIAAVALAHTRDDQAETFLLRLARGSGVDGLAAMAPVTRAGGILWLRPLLGIDRASLRVFLQSEGIGWAEDGSNADLRFDRIRMRAALPGLAALGLGPARLAATAAAMARARVALEAATAALAARAARPQPFGEVLLDPGELRPAPEELRLRLLSGTLAWVAGSRYRPRLARVLEADALLDPAGRPFQGLTLHGCVLRPVRGGIAVRREPARVGPAVGPGHHGWDDRWAIKPPVPEGLTLGALGPGGLAQAPDWRRLGIARETLVTTPVLREGDRVVASLLPGLGRPLGARRIAPLTPPWGNGADHPPP